MVLSWLSNPTTRIPPRQAFVIARVNKQTHELVIDLLTRSIVSNNIYNGFGNPLTASNEQNAAVELALNYGPLIESVHARGLNMSEVTCVASTVGWYGEVERSPRMVKILCFYRDGNVNFWMRPIDSEGRRN